MFVYVETDWWEFLYYLVKEKYLITRHLQKSLCGSPSSNNGILWNDEISLSRDHEVLCLPYWTKRMVPIFLKKEKEVYDPIPTHIDTIDFIILRKNTRRTQDFTQNLLNTYYLNCKSPQQYFNVQEMVLLERHHIYLSV